MDTSEPEPVKPGKNTTEFIGLLLPWLGFFALLVLVGIGRVELADIQYVLSALGIGGGIVGGKYAESRGIVKAGG